MAAALQEVPAGEVDALKKRKLVAPCAWKTYQLSKGPKFALERRKQATDLTFDMLQKCAPSVCVRRVGPPCHSSHSTQRMRMARAAVSSVSVAVQLAKLTYG